MRLRAKVLGLLLTAVVPSIALFATAAIRQRNSELSETSAEIARHAHATAAVIDASVEQIRATLSLLAKDEAVRRVDPERCRALFASWMAEHPEVLNLGITSPEGEYLASALPIKPGTEASQRPWLHRALATGEFAVGDYQIGQLTGKPSVNFALPLRGEAGPISAVLYAAIAPDWLLRDRLRTSLPPSAVWMVVDARGTVLAREPQGQALSGVSVAESPNVVAILQGVRGLHELVGVDGVRRLYSIVPVIETGGGGLYLTVGVEPSQAYARADRNFLVLFLVLLGAASLSIVVAWLATDRTALARIRRLTTAAGELERGDQDSRVGGGGDDELGQLARAFDAMAEGLQARSREQARVESELRAADERFRLLVEGARDYAIYTLDPEGRVTSWNRGAELMKGWSAEEILGQSFEIFFTPEDRAAGKPRETLARARAGGDHVYESSHVRKDGSRFHAHVTVSALRDEHGTLRGFSKITRDISERRESEHVLRASEARVRAIVDSAIDGIITADEQGQIESVNPATERLFGYAASELVGRPATVLIPAALRVEHERGLRRYLETGEKRVIGIGRELPGLHRDGRLIPLHISVNEMTVNGRRMFTAIVRDISAQVQAEGERRDREARLRAVVETAVDGIVTIDDEGRIETANPAAGRLFGYELGELVGRPVQMVMPERELTSGEGSAAGSGREVVGRRKDGSTFPIELTVSEFQIGAERLFLGILRDVTARKLAEDEIRSWNQELEARVEARTGQLEAANRELEAFSYSVSHDLRAPLRHINGFVNLLRESLGQDLNERARRQMDTIQTASGRMGVLIDDILAFSKVGRMEMRRARVELGPLVQSAWQEVAPESEQRRVRVEIGNLPAMSGDSVMLRQVFVNLFSNAIKFTRTVEAPVVRVEVADMENGDIVLSVKDNGVGFDMAYVGKLFGVFQRLHSNEQFEGTGIGLAIVQRVVQRHGGSVRAESGPEGGASFYLRFPGSLLA